jgi:hypothetical protein
MPMPNQQPTLPPEGAYTDAEQLFISESPPKLFPENQNSNFGLLRRVLTSQPQEGTDTLTQLVAQMFIATATGTNGYLGLWEKQLGLPVAPTGVSDIVRRSRLSLHRSIDLFSTLRIEETIESFLAFTSGGIPTSLTPTGVPTSAAGITLYGEGGTTTSQYRVYYNPRNFSYEVWIVNSSTPDLVTLTRELKFITPAGMTVTIDNTKTAIIDYGKTVLNKQPAAFFRLADFTDSSGNADHGTSALASPGLLVAGKNDDQAGKTFDGATGYFTAPDQNWLDFGDIFSIEFWFKPAIVSAGQRMIVDKGGNGFFIWQNGNQLQFGKSGVLGISQASPILVAGNTYHVVLRKSGPDKCNWRINNVLDTPTLGGTVAQRTIENTPFPLYIGRNASSAANYYNGGLDEIAFYDRWISDAESTENYNAGKLINL